MLDFKSRSSWNRKIRIALRCIVLVATARTRRIAFSNDHKLLSLAQLFCPFNPELLL